MPAPGDQYRDTPATTNPFLPAAPAISQYTAREIATLQSRLDKQLGPEYISTRPGNGGGKVHYLAAEKVINLANEVFGFNGWSSSIQNVTIDFVDEHENGKVSLGLSTIVRVTVRDGTFHEDVGYGHIENCKGKAAAFEKAKKEGATDGMKRALRNFGNVLGNCLYDKDYLQKVQKVKAMPSRWSAEDLHRHHDFGPVKVEGAGRGVSQQQVNSANGAITNGSAVNGQQGGAGVRRNPSMQSVNSVGSGEFEDDNVFDETDFSHPDEVRLDDSTTAAAIQSPAQQQMQAQRNGLNRMHSAPHLRPPNMHPPEAPNGMQAPQRPEGMQRPSNLGPQAPATRMQPPQMHANTDGAGSRSHTSSLEETTAQQPRHPPQRPTTNDIPAETYQPPPFQDPPPDIPGGFITGRSAAFINAAPDARPPAASLAFNPHAESPSIRRTHGVNPGKSAPILRTNLATTAPMTAPPGGLVPPSAAASLQQGGANGVQVRANSNFMNPAADPNRRIGMPQAGGLRNGSAYKTPTNLKRPVMADVTNLPQVDGAPEAKKLKVDGVEGGEGGGAVVS
ncbi:DNA repair protein rad52 [Oleoguttula sp. CCFEE 5521]